ncbi:hypothetical protein LUZ62_019973 [Rhynchospora pubera]|uniref:Uncharacterized protein n=1 Tax=Rhynchospora pubera TaxID=906938 RepID=A0AAV8GY52_9POAL|nr:hypothetical protein LUZ62_019973 [Rhynchospora pubera]
MECMHCLVTWVFLIWILFLHPCTSQSPASELDSLLQDYMYQSLRHPHTGIIYTGQVPANLTGVSISALRLRSGSLRKRGFQDYMQFDIPVGVLVQPYVERLIFVYQNLGNWSSYYYPLTGFTYLTPVIGLLAYDAANLSSTDLSYLEFVASESPISIDFRNLSNSSAGADPKCVWFDLAGKAQFRDLVSSNKCDTYRGGHFAIAVNTSGISPTPAPAGPTHHKKKISSKAWKIIGGTVGGLVVLILLSILICCIVRFRREKKVKEMENRAEAGEPLHFARFGGAQAPVALGTRTQPVLENEYTAVGLS